MLGPQLPADIVKKVQPPYLIFVGELSNFKCVSMLQGPD